MPSDNRQPLVSIIVPAYNAEPYLAETLDSALTQTYPNIEIIVVNDGSKDGTAEIGRRYAARHPGKIFYFEQANAGVSAARKNAIERSRGEYITFVDADDLLLPQKAERQVAYLEAHPECDACYSEIYHFLQSEPEKLFKLE